MTQTVFNLSSLNGQNGFVLNGGPYVGAIGYSVGGIGDFNGDGFKDVIIFGDGEGYVVFGSKVGFNASFNLKNLNGIKTKISIFFIILVSFHIHISFLFFSFNFFL